MDLTKIKKLGKNNNEIAELLGITSMTLCNWTRRLQPKKSRMQYKYVTLINYVIEHEGESKLKEIINES